IPIAVGAAQSIRIRGVDAIAVSFFGDGALNRGPFSESLNWAAAFGLPLLFVCEDNQWSATTRTDAMSAGGGAAERSRSYGVPAVAVDGNDVAAVHAAAGRLVEEIRAGKGPRLLHARTYRFSGHVSVDPAAYRDPDELAAALADDPLERARRLLADAGATAGQAEAVMDEARAEVEAARASAAAAPWPEHAAAFEQVQDQGGGRWT